MTPAQKQDIERSFHRMGEALKPLVEQDAERIRKAFYALGRAANRSINAHRVK